MVGCLELQNGTVFLIFVAKCFRNTVKKKRKMGNENVEKYSLCWLIC